MEKKNKKLPIIIGAIALVIIAVVIVVVVNNKGHRVIKVESFAGDVALERGSSKKDMVEGMNLKSKDTVTTGSDGLVELLVDTDKHIVASENTSFKITSSGSEEKGKLKIELLYGTSLVEIDKKLQKGSSVEVETPNATLSVRGTIFETSYTEDEDKTVVKVTDGVVKIATAEETVELEAGNMATIKDDKIKVSPLPIEYEDKETFEVRYSTTNEFSGIHVKWLKEWTYIASAQNKNGPDLFERHGVKIRYWVYTEDEVNADIDNSGETGHLIGVDYIKNDDGDTIICCSYDLNGESGIKYAYQYFKKVQDDMYLSIFVFDERNGEAVGDDTLEYYLALTNNCYYTYSIEVE
ncbi:MAG: FecR domain-containing protein [Lachnospiraceae bacterium]|nr:FecR domain-containing protein [Lachnospiraceae bacterium]